MAKTNKALLKAGLGYEEIVELLEMYLVRDHEEYVHEVEMQGFDDDMGVFFKDFHDRKYHVVIEAERPETFYFSTSKVDDEECNEQNRKEFKSITAVLNQITRMCA